MDDMRRCLFPIVEPRDTSFDSQLLDSAAMIQATDPDASIEDEKDKSEEKSRPRDSPVGVAELFPDSLKSTIHVGENGAEVSLGIERLSIQTPERGFSEKLQSRRSLMDLCTPTPPPVKMNPNYGFCGNASANCVIDDTYDLPTGRSLEEVISNLLGEDENNSRWNGCSNWQECAFSGDSTPQERIAADRSIDSARLTNLRQRAFNLKTRQKRVHQLRKDLSPFNKSPARTPPFTRSRSFSIADHAPAIMRQTTEARKMETANHSASWLCSLPENSISESPMLIRYKASDFPQDACYDSDPEDFARHRSPKRARQSRFHLSAASSGDSCAAYNQNILIEEFLNQSFTLIYHPSPTESRGVSRPIAMEAWLERGQILQELIQPKWLFRPKASEVYQKGLMMTEQDVRSIELLEITRILELPVVDKKRWPFARPFKTFLIRDVHGEDFCFEAQSVADCDLIAYSLKLSIARFGAMVITSNHQIYEDFFASTESCVPGEAPAVAKYMDETTDSDDSSVSSDEESV